MELFGKMELNTYLCRAKKERDGLRHQRYITQTGYRTLPEFAKKETLRIIPQQFQARQHDTVQLTYPNIHLFEPLDSSRKLLIFLCISSLSKYASSKFFNTLVSFFIM